MEPFGPEQDTSGGESLFGASVVVAAGGASVVVAIGGATVAVVVTSINCCWVAAVVVVGESGIITLLHFISSKST